MCLKLAVRNVKRQMENYLIYFMTVALTVALLFAIYNIVYSDSLSVFVDRGKEARTALRIMVVMISMVVAFVLSYATSFLLKRRKREFGTYLTLGMTRRNLLSLFLTETMVICGVALGVGLAAGSFLFQGLMAVMMKLLEMEFSIAAYSLDGLFHTVLLTVGIFLVASAASAVYLKRVAIYDLIHGEKKVERGVRHPILWFAATLLALGAMISCGALFWRETIKAMEGGRVDGMEHLLAISLASVTLFHMGMAKSIVFLLMRRRRFCSRGANTFVLRQLSGSLSANALMLGCLALLLALAVAGTNFSFINRVGQEEILLSGYPYDIMYYPDKNEWDGLEGTQISPEEADSIIQVYAGIDRKVSYHIYESGGQDFHSRTQWGEMGMAPMDSFMTVSDFNKIMGPLGVEPIELEGQFMIVCNNHTAAAADWTDMAYERDGQRLTFHSCRTDYPKISYQYFYIVVPDETVAGMECAEECVGYLTEKHRYDGIGLKKALTYHVATSWGEGEKCDFEIREYVRQEENNVSAILVVGALFVAAVFLLLAMAILALKTLSGLGEDRRRYEILFRLGMGEREQARTLFWQTFSFFLLPFALPLLLGIPVAAFGIEVMRTQGMESAAGTVPLIAGVVAGGMALLYLLYYTASYLIARRAVVWEGVSSEKGRI